jgi:hypothetical protein
MTEKEFIAKIKYQFVIMSECSRRNLITITAGDTGVDMTVDDLSSVAEIMVCGYKNIIDLCSQFQDGREIGIYNKKVRDYIGERYNISGEWIRKMWNTHLVEYMKYKDDNNLDGVEPAVWACGAVKEEPFMSQEEISDMLSGIKPGQNEGEDGHELQPL